MGKQKEYELVAEIRYIVKANNVHHALERWNGGDLEAGDVTTEKVLDITEVK